MFLIDRPYVTMFLACFLALALPRWGVRRTLLWMLSGYAIALASEACSIRTGFPYGWYFYKYENLANDPLVFGVPVWDSLSYTFLIYAGYAQAQRWYPHASAFAQALFGGWLTMALDVVIDPVAHLGDRWFLGDIYYYQHPGWYFGVPLSNFAGWFFVSWLVIRANQYLTARGDAMPSGAPTWCDAGFYWGIMAFNVGITVWVQAYALVAASTLVCLALLIWEAHRTQYKSKLIFT